jgi:hypothetical protein
MRFKLAPREPNYDRLKLVSENGRWELGLWSVMFGVRVRCGLTGECGVSLDYCAGADPLFQMELLNAIHIILQEVPEDISVADFEDMFPQWAVRPVNHDPLCWPELQRMRDEARTRLGIADEFYPITA